MTYRPQHGAQTPKASSQDPKAITPSRSLQQSSGQTATFRQTQPDDHLKPKAKQSVGHSAALMSAANIISRLTGFLRTMIMAYALGSTMLSSSYQIANNVPNMIYELAVGGVLVTAFLPVYISVKNREGQGRANEYASNLLGFVFLALLIVSLLGTVFAPQIIWTQTFMSEASESSLAVYFFRFFAIQILLYGIGAIFSGLLNAARDYFIASFASVFNNIVVIITFLGFILIAPNDDGLARTWLAVGTSLGVFIQMMVQIPALRKNGIHLRMGFNFRDPAFRETFHLGLPALVTMIDTTVAVSVYTAVAFGISTSGPSVISYSRMWYTLPYAFLAVPITTAMFTEFSNWFAEKDSAAFRSGFVLGARQILFFMLPCALYLIVFATPLVNMYHAGAFTSDDVTEVATYLMWLAASLPLYAILTYFNKVYSALHDMVTFVKVDIINTLLQIVLFVVLGNGIGSWHGLGLIGVAIATFIYNILGVIILTVLLSRRIGHIEKPPLIKSLFTSMGLAVLGAAVGFETLVMIERYIAPLTGGFAQSFVYVLVCGTVALLGTYIPALLLDVPEAKFLKQALGKLHL